jgi:hypothetical protein
LPSSSVDTFLACSVMILLVLSAMIGTSKLMAPYLNDLANRDSTDRFQHLASNLLLTTGSPSNWGQLKTAVPSAFGLALADAVIPYELDLDKVTRLNNENVYSLAYSDIWQAFGVCDASFQIEIKMLFDLSVQFVSNLTQGSQTVYEFQVHAEKSGMPISADLRSYVVLGDFVNNTEASTSSNGTAIVTIGIPNSINGTALLLTFARSTVNPQAVSYVVHAFSHNSPSLLPNGTFVSLSPLNYVLNASFPYAATQVIRAQVFSFSYNFNLTELAQGTQTVQYAIPRLIDASVSIMVLTGYNESTSFAEWVAYPQVPLQIGADFSESIAGSRVAVYSQVVTVGSALYEVVTRWGGLSNSV